MIFDKNSYVLYPIMIVAIIVFVVVLSFALSRGKAKRKGQEGETKVNKLIEQVIKECGGYYVSDVIIPYGTKSTQVDHIYFSNRGIFVIETKNYSGRVYGKEDATYWTQVLAYGNKKERLYNPVKQNQTHVNAIRKILSANLPLEPMVVFVQNNTLYIRSNYVYTMKEAYVKMTNKPICMSDEDAFKAYNKIKFLKDNPIISEEDHIKSVKQSHR